MDPNKPPRDFWSHNRSKTILVVIVAVIVAYGLVLLTPAAFAQATSHPQTKSPPTTTEVDKTGRKKTVKPAAKVQPPNEARITECDAGDSKCMEEKAKLEIKPTDGAIQKER